MGKSEIREYVEAFILAVILALFIITFIAQSFRVDGSSMEPTLHNSQRLIVDKISYRFNQPHVGDILVFRYPTDMKRMFIKRIIGVPGDDILIKDGTVYRNGQPLVENYINGPTHGAFTRNYGPIVVPEDSYFVLGDNRLNSDDSRYPDVGFVPKENIIGRAIFIYWPLNTVGVLKIPSVLRTFR